MKNTKIIYSAVIIISVLIIAGFALNNTNKDKLKQKSPIEIFPEITAKLYKGGVYTVPQEYKDGKTMVVFFSPECDLCEEELNVILKNELPSSNRWVFISFSFLKDELEFFLERTPIDTLNNSVILLEDSPKYHSLFHVTGPPSLFVYNEEGELIHSSYGKVDDRTLIDWIK